MRQSGWHAVPPGAGPRHSLAVLSPVGLPGTQCRHGGPDGGQTAATAAQRPLARDKPHQGDMLLTSPSRPVKRAGVSPDSLAGGLRGGHIAMAPRCKDAGPTPTCARRPWAQDSPPREPTHPASRPHHIEPHLGSVKSGLRARGRRGAWGGDGGLGGTVSF